VAFGEIGLKHGNIIPLRLGGIAVVDKRVNNGKHGACENKSTL